MKKLHDTNQTKLNKIQVSFQTLIANPINRSGRWFMAWIIQLDREVGWRRIDWLTAGEFNARTVRRDGRTGGRIRW